MATSFPLDLLFISGIGGILLNVINLWEDSKKPKSFRVEKDVLYWIFFLIWPLVGAFLTFVYIQSKYNVDPMLALITGLTAPTTIQALVAKAAPPAQPLDNETEVDEATDSSPEASKSVQSRRSKRAANSTREN